MTDQFRQGVQHGGSNMIWTAEKQFRKYQQGCAVHMVQSNGRWNVDKDALEIRLDTWDWFIVVVILL